MLLQVGDAVLLIEDPAKDFVICHLAEMRFLPSLCDNAVAVCAVGQFQVEELTVVLATKRCGLNTQ